MKNVLCVFWLGFFWGSLIAQIGDMNTVMSINARYAYLDCNEIPDMALEC
jgi:hypothetical protein